MKEQEQRWKEATEKGLGETPARELDLEDTMMSQEEEDKQPEGEKQKADEGEGYGRVYTKTHEKRVELSMSHAERREQDKKRKKEEAAKKAAQEAADRLKQEEAKHIIERAQLEEEEMAVQKRLECKRKLQEMAEEKEMQEMQETQETQGVPAKVSATSKKQWKEYLGLKA